MKNENKQFAIKYSVIKISKTEYILKPDKLLIGKKTKIGFKSENGEEFPIICDEIDDSKDYADTYFTLEELINLFDYEIGSPTKKIIKKIGERLFEETKKMFIYVNTKEFNDAGCLCRTPFNLNAAFEDDASVYYMDDKNFPNAIFNHEAVRQLTEAKDMSAVKEIVRKCQMRLNSLDNFHKNAGCNKISMLGDKINYYEASKSVNENELKKAFEGSTKIIANSGSFGKKDVSYIGLRDYIRERIYGHDEEVDTFAQKMFMNYTAQEGEQIESILFVGPTGVGKTETVEVACKYLDMPMVSTNAADLVTEGIQGTSIQRILYTLYKLVGEDLEKAQRGAIFLDEYDKIHTTDLSTKAPVKDILLTFISGGKIPVNIGGCDFVFDSTMTTKLFAGVFEKITNRQKTFGFAIQDNSGSIFDSSSKVREKIMEKKYMTHEELSRITTVLGYSDLPIDVKKDILLNCKSSVYLAKRDRYERQFGIELVMDKDYVDCLIGEKVGNAPGMRVVNNEVIDTINQAERFILENADKGYKQLILTRDTVYNHRRFELIK